MCNIVDVMLPPSTLFNAAQTTFGKTISLSDDPVAPYNAILFVQRFNDYLISGMISGMTCRVRHYVLLSNHRPQPSFRLSAPANFLSSSSHFSLSTLLLALKLLENRHASVSARFHASTASTVPLFV